MTALVLSAVLAAAPTLPVVDGIDQGAESRGAILAQIIAHQEYTHHMHRVWHKRRQEATKAAESVPEPSTTYSGDMGWADELRAVGFPESVIPTMLYIIQRESGGDPSAMNASGACGLLQIYPYQEGCLDPMTNLQMGYAKYQASGLSPWGL